MLHAWSGPGGATRRPAGLSRPPHRLRASRPA